MSDTLARAIGYSLSDDAVRWEIISDLPPYTSFNGRGWVLHMPDIVALGFNSTMPKPDYTVALYTCNGITYKVKPYRARIVLTLSLGNGVQHKWAASDTISIRAPGPAQRAAHCNGIDPLASEGMGWPWRNTPSWAN